jgi:hypothetical protein
MRLFYAIRSRHLARHQNILHRKVRYEFKMMNSLLTLLAVLLFSGISLQAKTLEIRIFTVSGEMPRAGQLSDQEEALFDKGLVAFDLTLSLRVSKKGEIAYHQTKGVNCGTRYTAKGIPKGFLTRATGVTVSGVVKKSGDQYSINFKCNRTSLLDNQVEKTMNGTAMYHPEFSEKGIETEVELYPNQWVLFPYANLKDKGVLALKLTE